MAETNPLETCPTCGRSNLYVTVRSVSAVGGRGPNLLPGLGGFWTGARFRIVLCRDCGLTRFFATRDALEKLPTSPKWTRINESAADTPKA